jgi:hypothetical protein
LQVLAATHHADQADPENDGQAKVEEVHQEEVHHTLPLGAVMLLDLPSRPAQDWRAQHQDFIKNSIDLWTSRSSG